MSVLLSSTLANESTPYFALAGSTPAPVSPFVTGMIIMFNGITAPTGWAYCDGTQGTPNLLDKFVICSSGTHPLGSTGGSVSATLALANLPDHIHGGVVLSATSGSAGGGGFSFAAAGNTTGITSPGWTPTPTPVSIVPPYYALAYIMKL
jgi:microcystin-dependent protein